MNIPEVQERLGISEPVIGHLTSLTQLSDAAEFSPRDPQDLRAECEIAIRVGADGRSVDGYAAAIEIVDVGRPPGGAEGIVAENIFHRAFALGEFTAEPPAGEASLDVGGEAHQADQPVPDFEQTVGLVARNLEAVGEELKPGDVIISGALVAVPVRAGERITADLGGPGTVTVTLG
jgi:2-keto-4-pentenoate hydratase